MFESLFKGWRRGAASTAAQWRSQGNAALGRGELDEAADCYRRAIEADAADPLARVNLGYALLEKGRPGEAAQHLQQATGLAASDAETRADAHYLLARAHRTVGSKDTVLENLRFALAARPAFETALQELVPLLVQAGHVEEAVTTARRAVAAQATPACLMQLAQALHARGDADAVLAVLDDVLAREPDHPAALESRATLLLEHGRAAEALAGFDRVLARQGPDPDILCNRAVALLRLGRADESLAAADAALRLQPAHRQAMHTRSRALLALLRVRDARDFTLDALRLYPDDADLRWNSAVAHLLLGEFDAGWQAHEARWDATGFIAAAGPTIATAPRWTGRESLSGATILLFAEQGMGDAIQFLRYVPRVASLAREVLLRVPPQIAPLATALAPNCRVVEAAAAASFDFQCPLLSLPHAFGTTVSDVPADVPYLHADAARVAQWSDRLASQPRPRVGVMWSGNPRHTNDHNRSIALDEFKAIADAPVRFVNLQPVVRESERDALASWPGLIDAGAELRDFGDTAALLMALDLVITVDTSVAHLAGALGRPVWILLPYLPDWRWMLARIDSPWYPTARLYRQPAPGAWGPVLKAVRADLDGPQ